MAEARVPTLGAGDKLPQKFMSPELSTNLASTLATLAEDPGNPFGAAVREYGGGGNVVYVYRTGVNRDGAWPTTRPATTSQTVVAVGAAPEPTWLLDWDEHNIPQVP